MHIETDKIYVQINGKRQEAKGEVLENLLQAQAEMQAEQNRIEAEQTAKAEAKASAMAKLAALGLSEEEVQAIIGA
jgi:regulator of protease activity HflC (stomatin/prohibitin superfamily)